MQTGKTVSLLILDSSISQVMGPRYDFSWLSIRILGALPMALKPEEAFLLQIP